MSPGLAAAGAISPGSSVSVFFLRDLEFFCWHTEEVTRPKCQAGPNSPCSPRSPHRERVEWAQEFTRKLWG